MMMMMMMMLDDTVYVHCTTCRPS